MASSRTGYRSSHVDALYRVRSDGVDRAEYRHTLHSAFNRQYRERTDEWTRDVAMRATPAIVQGRLKLGPGSAMLDIGCGAGDDVAYFAAIYASATGIDICARPEWQIFSAQSENVDFAAAEFLDWTPPRKYNLVLDNGCFHHQHVEGEGAYLGKVASILEAGGWFVLSTFKNAGLSERYDANGRRHRYFSDVELHERLAAAGFVLLDEIDMYRLAKGDFYRLSFCGRS